MAFLSSTGDSLIISGEEEESMKVIIDRSTCVSCGSCWDICPEFFEQNPDDSFSQVIEKYRSDGNIAEGIPVGESEACIQEAADSCPVQIISITE